MQIKLEVGQEIPNTYFNFYTILEYIVINQQSFMSDK